MVTLKGMNTHYILRRKTLENQIQIMQKIYFPSLICVIVTLAREKSRVLGPGGEKVDKIQMSSLEISCCANPSKSKHALNTFPGALDASVAGARPSAGHGVQELGDVNTSYL